MRARQDLEFVQFLIRIGNGTEPANERDEIEIPQPMLIPYTTMEQSIEDLILGVPTVGTRLICKQLTPNLIGAIIATGQFKGKHVWIPRIPLEPNSSDNKYLIPFVRRQFPLRLCFAMTINKAQGQKLDCVGLYLRQPVFSHGQLYVALSRAKTGENVRILIFSPICTDPGTKYTTNVVYNEVLVKANLT
ncbi:hypothetical protein LIER_26590 [Lithospermum erythrorhizon]|uniref:ATP-dependent DNA helicase n=1 Tax=Lithospermum erythrorhizon TaxID=34254 RepID=A0AAV3RA70_LITER